MCAVHNGYCCFSCLRTFRCANNIESNQINLYVWGAHVCTYRARCRCRCVCARVSLWLRLCLCVPLQLSYDDDDDDYYFSRPVLVFQSECLFRVKPDIFIRHLCSTLARVSFLAKLLYLDTLFLSYIDQMVIWYLCVFNTEKYKHTHTHTHLERWIYSRAYTQQTTMNSQPNQPTNKQTNMCNKLSLSTNQQWISLSRKRNGTHRKKKKNKDKHNENVFGFRLCVWGSFNPFNM